MIFITSNKSLILRFAKPAAAILVWIAVWELIALKIDNKLLFSSPADTAAKLCELAADAQFWRIAASSLLRVVKGFVLGIAVGSAAAVAAFRIKTVYYFLKPALSVVKATPVASFIILAMLWLGDRGAISSMISFLMVLPVAWGNVYSGLDRVDRGLVEMSRLYRFGRAKTWKLIYIPSVMPYFISACTTGLGLAWKAGVAAEVICRPDAAIGTEIYNAKIYIETEQLFAWTTVVVLLSVTLERLLVYVMRRTLKRYNVVPGGDGYADRN